MFNQILPKLNLDNKQRKSDFQILHTKITRKEITTHLEKVLILLHVIYCCVNIYYSSHTFHEYHNTTKSTSPHLHIRCYWLRIRQSSKTLYTLEVSEYLNSNCVRTYHIHWRMHSDVYSPSNPFKVAYAVTNSFSLAVCSIEIVRNLPFKTRWLPQTPEASTYALLHSAHIFHLWDSHPSCSKQLQCPYTALRDRSL